MVIFPNEVDDLVNSYQDRIKNLTLTPLDIGQTNSTVKTQLSTNKTGTCIIKVKMKGLQGFLPIPLLINQEYEQSFINYDWIIKPTNEI